MPVPILITKIILPPWREEILSCIRLTSLLLEVAHYSELPLCWYTLDTLDQEFDRFLSHFIASIKDRFYLVKNHRPFWRELVRILQMEKKSALCS
jgi:hypothetical protein